MAIMFIKGDDATLVAQALRKAVAEFVGDQDSSLMVDEVGEAQYSHDDGDLDLVPVVVAAYTPPFLTPRRVVVARNMALFTRAEMVTPLVKYLESPAATTDLIIVWEKGANSPRMGSVPKKLNEALKKVGAEVVNAAPSGKGRRGLLEEKLTASPLNLDRAAKHLFADRLGDDVGRADGVLEALVSSFGEGRSLRADDIEPFLGQASDVPPWELTDAIDSGDIGLALEKLSRMTNGGSRHALQVTATLNNHYQRVLGLDGAPVADDKSAAAHLGMKGSTFPAKKALNLSRKLGWRKIRRIVGLLAQADLDLRGASAIPSHTTVEVLVARLAQMSR